MTFIDTLYEAFSDVQKPVDLIGCRNGCCMNQFEVDELLGQPLRNSSPHLIWLYLENAIHTAGTVSNFKYFVPRILDLIQQCVLLPDENASLDFHICIFGGRLADANFDQWSASQKNAVDDVFFETVKKLQAESNPKLATDCLCAVAQTDLSKARYFALLDIFENLTAKTFFGYSWKHIRLEGRIKGGFWDNVPTASAKEVWAWLMLKEENHRFRNEGRKRNRKN